MTYNTIQTETHGRVGLIRLHRPQALNALNAELAGEPLASVLEAREVPHLTSMTIVIAGLDPAIHSVTVVVGGSATAPRSSCSTT